jgi:hypothetical protein
LRAGCPTTSPIAKAAVFPAVAVENFAEQFLYREEESVIWFFCSADRIAS